MTSFFDQIKEKINKEINPENIIFSGLIFLLIFLSLRQKNS